MGQLVIDIPQNINLKFNVESVITATEILKLARNPKHIKTIKPNVPNDLDDIDVSEVYNVWANRKESADEIAQTIRDKNNGKI